MLNNVLGNKINIYLFLQISKNIILILFIFLSIAWLLQISRLFTVTNFISMNVLDIILLSFYLIPNLITVIIPFILIFGLLLCFIKLNKDNELISILSLGFGLKPFKFSLLIFIIFFSIIFIFLNFYISPKIYEIYKVKEYDLRNTLDLNNMSFTNFLNINSNTILDFKKNNNEYEDILISFQDDKENIVYAKKGNIISKDNYYNFQLINGFKLSIDEKQQLEKLEFENYILKIGHRNIKNFEIVDKNTLTIFDDIYNKNYLNISYKVIDIIFIILIVLFFYNNNLKKIQFNTFNNIYFALLCIFVLIINQILKNSEIILINYFLMISGIIVICFLISYLKNKYEQD
tara:strand:- start:14137 stop:15177 length:1041 start_codon:yes stop_codon:yes gene_type:complete